MASQKMLNQYPPVLSVKQVAEILAVSQIYGICVGPFQADTKYPCGP